MRSLLFCGDIHGEWETFIWTVLSRYKITESDVVILGDFGVGFDNTLNDNYNKVKSKLEKADVTIYVLRGNHDDPKYFVNESEYSFPRLIFMEDYKLYELGGKTILPIGGANSTDIVERLKNNETWKAKGSKKREWWEGEDIIRKPISELPKKVDVIVTHSCPISFEPILSRFDETPVEQYEKIKAERDYLEEVKNEVSTKYWLYGHYHNSYSGSYGKSLYRCLGIMEFFEIYGD